MSCRDCKYYAGEYNREYVKDHVGCDWLYKKNKGQLVLPPYLSIYDNTMMGIAIGTQSCYPKTVHKDTSLKCECFESGSLDIKAER